MASSRVVRIFVDAALPPEAEARLRAGAGDHALSWSRSPAESNLTASAPDPAAANAEVLFGQPSLETLDGAARAQWVHLTSAGYARYATPEAGALLAARGLRLTTSSEVYAVPCAEQALAGLLLLGRGLDRALAEGPAWRSAEHRRRAALLRGSRVVLLGFGAIGRALAPRLSALGAEVVALRRRPDPEDPIRTVGRDALAAELGQADHVVSLLPGGPETTRFVDDALLGAIRPGACFVNIGRGTTVDQDALGRALDGGHLAGAYLDVTDPEPLPADHPLWRARRALISPHVAGGRPDEQLALVEHFLANLDRFLRGAPLVDRVDHRIPGPERP
jgi:phosphoglycerate dehydrogenase-like enzyme